MDSSEERRENARKKSTVKSPKSSKNKSFVAVENQRFKTEKPPKGT